MLTIEHLTKRFAGATALTDVSFSISPGEIFSLIGPNGSGKTTIVKIITGLLHPDAGVVKVGGIDVTEDPKGAKALIGYIPDEPTVWSGMSGEEYLHFVGALYGMERTLRAKRIATLLPLFHLNGIEGDYFENYSRGNKQKFTILGALLHEPKLLLIDEPIVGLDPESAIIAKNLFSDFAKQGGAVLLVTHTLPVAEEISTRIGVLQKGALLSSGTLRELKARASVGDGAELEEVYTALTSKS
jgi:ABC-2 type transport system ATP-binding protein